MQKHAYMVDQFRVNKNQVKIIFVDETLIQIDGKDYWLWVAYEPNADLCLTVHISRERTILVCYQFFKELRKRFGRKKPIFTDGARWYNDACKWLRLKHQVYSTKLKNVMERFIQKIKDRTECFDDHFPCRSENCNKRHVINWIKMFILYLHMKTDRTKLTKFLMENS
jgi:putative transposase